MVRIIAQTASEVNWNGKIFYSQEHQKTNGNSNSEIVSALKKETNGNGNGISEAEEHDEEQYLDLIRKIMKKGEPL